MSTLTQHQDVSIVAYHDNIINEYLTGIFNLTDEITYWLESGGSPSAPVAQNLMAAIQENRRKIKEQKEIIRELNKHV